MTSIVCILAFSISLSVESMASDSIDEAEEKGFKVVRTIPLEETSFTQGLEVLMGRFSRAPASMGDQTSER